MNATQNTHHRARILRPRPRLEQTFLEVLWRVGTGLVLGFLLGWGLAFYVSLTLWFVLLVVYDRLQFRRRWRLELREAEFKGWLARVNQAASRRGWHEFDFTEDRWRALWAEGKTPEEALK